MLRQTGNIEWIKIHRSLSKGLMFPYAVEAYKGFTEQQRQILNRWCVTNVSKKAISRGVAWMPKDNGKWDTVRNRYCFETESDMVLFLLTFVTYEDISNYCF